VTVVRSEITTNSANQIIVDCGSGKHAIGGGIAQRGSFVVGDHMVSTYPSDSAGAMVADNTVNPRYFTIRVEPHEGGTNDGWIGSAYCLNN